LHTKHMLIPFELRRVCVALASALFLVAIVPGDASAEFPEERLDFKIEERADGRLTFRIETRIPTPFEAVVGVALSGQQPRDVYIGHAERVFIDRPNSEIVLDLRHARMRLPEGSYRARVAFYNAWGWRNGNRRAADVPDTIIEKSVLLQASGMPPADARSRAEKQRWVFLNVKPQMRWVPSFLTRNIGPFETVETGPLTAYYFPEARVTFSVSQETEQIVGWVFGLRTSPDTDGS
jgi:hypothetical protein